MLAQYVSAAASVTTARRITFTGLIQSVKIPQKGPSEETRGGREREQQSGEASGKVVHVVWIHDVMRE
jgi:hypothetical protein